MSRKGSTGEIRVEFVPAAVFAAIATPDLSAELTGAVNLTPYMRRDGLTTPRSANTIDASDAASRVNKTAPGNIDLGSLTYRAQRDSVSGSDTAWSTLAEDTAGAFIVRRFGGSGVALAATQKVEVYLGSVISREMQPIGDETQNFTVSFSISDSTQDATIAA